MEEDEELKSLKVELWKVYKTIQAINSIAEERELTDEEKDKLQYLLKQFKSIKQEIAEHEADLP